jgi:hypothetical protein
MTNFTTTTGKGVFKNNGIVISKYDLPPGEYNLKGGYVAEDVADHAALNAVIVPEPELTNKQKRAKLIRDKKNDMAIEKLKEEGKLDANGELV